ncbi:MAG: bifunctional ADP-heptose synthase [Bacteroidales bacterium]|jgi:rfaE bifunctional protein kinase chain/domain
MANKEIHDIFNSFNSLKALVIGDVMVDSYLWGKVERISPEAPVPIVAVNKRENRLGGAANVALNIQALGATPILCSIVGDESKGESFIELLQKQDMTDEGIIKSPNRITTTKFRIIGNHSQMLRVDEEVEHDLTEKETILLFERIEKIVENKKIDVIIFEDYDKGIITPLLISKVTELARRKNIPVVADPKKKNFKHYIGISLFKPNLKELNEGLKLDLTISNLTELSVVIDKLHEEKDIATIMVTLSEAGIYISKRNTNNKNSTNSKIIPAHIRNIADVSGAGDTVISVASLCLALNLDIHLIASLANLAGGLVCEEVGVVPINKQKLIAEALQLFNGK